MRMNPSVAPLCKKKNNDDWVSTFTWKSNCSQFKLQLKLGKHLTDLFSLVETKQDSKDEMSLIPQGFL